MRDGNIEIEDRILLKKAAREGCSESLSAIYTKYQPAVCDFLRKIGADGDAEDICQAVFMEVLDGKCKYDGSSEPKTFLFGVTVNIHKNGLKATKMETYGLSPAEIDGDLLVQGSTSMTPHEALENAETRRIIRGMVAQLPPKTRQAVKLAYIKGFSPKTAAEKSGSDFKAFRVRLDYGIKQLQNNAKKDGV